MMEVELLIAESLAMGGLVAGGSAVGGLVAGNSAVGSLGVLVEGH